MTTLIYRLALRGAFHVGARGFAREVTESYIPSDTLYSALVVAWDRLGMDVESLLTPFLDGTAPLLLSSGYPYVGDVRFYPRPFLRHRVEGESLEDVLRGYRWVSEGLLGRLVRHEAIEPTTTTSAQDGSVWLLREEERLLPRSTRRLEGDSLIWRVQAVSRVTLDRVTNASQVYHIGRVGYAPGCGLWFAARVADQMWLERLEAGLSLLADEGIGGLRSIGHGAFSWERWDGASLPCPDETGDYALTLSRFTPGGDDGMQALLDERAIYRLTLVGGWSHGARGTRRRRSIRMVAEGSLFRRPLRGAVIDVTPAIADLGHPVYRFGLAFALPVAPEAVPTSEEAVYG